MNRLEQRANDLIWYGKEPTDWREFRIKDIVTLSPGFSSGRPSDDEICSVIPMESVSEIGDVSFERELSYADISPGLPNFENGDVIFAKITPCMENGKGAFITELPNRYAFGSTEFHVLRPSAKVLGKFLYYYTFNPVYRKFAEANMTGAAGQKRVSSKFIKYTRIFLPTIEEQNLIVQFLDRVCESIEAIIKIKQLDRERTILLEYKGSLIHECVTGKRRITTADLRESA